MPRRGISARAVATIGPGGHAPHQSVWPPTKTCVELNVDLVKTPEFHAHLSPYCSESQLKVFETR